MDLRRWALCARNARVRRRVRARRRGDRLCLHRVPPVLAGSTLRGFSSPSAGRGTEGARRADGGAVVHSRGVHEARREAGGEVGARDARGRTRESCARGSRFFRAHLRPSPAASSEAAGTPRRTRTPRRRGLDVRLFIPHGERLAPRPDSGRSRSRTRRGEERGRRSAADFGQAARAASAPMILADIGALEGFCPGPRLGAAVHGAKPSLGLHGDALARVGRATPCARRRSRRAPEEKVGADRALKPAPAQDARSYEDNPSLRGTLPRSRRRVGGWGAGATSLRRGWMPRGSGRRGRGRRALAARRARRWPKKRGEIDPAKGGVRPGCAPAGVVPRAITPSRCSVISTRTHATWPIEAGNSAKPLHPDPVPSTKVTRTRRRVGRLADRRRLGKSIDGARPRRGGPTTKLRGGEDGGAVRTPAPRIEAATGRTSTSRAPSDVETRTNRRVVEPPFGARRPGIDGAGAAARAAASPQRELLDRLRAPSSRAWTRARTPLADEAATEGGSSSAKRAVARGAGPPSRRRSSPRRVAT